LVDSVFLLSEMLNKEFLRRVKHDKNASIVNE